MIDQINKRPIDFRDKTICNLASDEITEVSVARDKDPFVLTKNPGKTGDELWKLSKPTGAKPDISKANAIAGFFHEWKAQKYAEDNLPKTADLAKPSAVISAKSKVPGHTCTLKIGGESADKGNYYVIANNQPNVYLVAKTDIDRITVKLDEVKAK
jgi:hypothetical protein